MEFPDKLIHLTWINSLYPILSSDFLMSRSESGVKPRFSFRDQTGNPGYVYLALDKLPGPIPGGVKLVFNANILKERSDYYLNLDWWYGDTTSSLNPDQINLWLSEIDDNSGEILFTNRISLDKYLIEIIIPVDSHSIIDMNQIPNKYRHLIKLVDQE